LTSPLPECGKTTVLDVLEYLARRAIRSDNITTSIAFRLMSHSPSLLLDELDTFIHDNPELIGVLNSGHKKGGYVFRMEKIEERQEIARFPTYGPVAYGMIGHPAGTLFSRSIFIRLERKGPNEKTEDFDPAENPTLEAELTKLRRQVVRWADDHREEVKNCQPDSKSLINRARNNWRPLLKIATAMGRVDTALLAAGLPPPRSKKSDQEKLLRDLRNIFHSRKVDRLPSAVLLADLLKQTESGWYRYHNHRDPLDVGDLADLLRDYDVGPKAFFIGEQVQLQLFKKHDKRKRFKGYTLKQFAPLFSKYLKGVPEKVELGDWGIAF
jgi:hypothetical protein